MEHPVVLLLAGNMRSHMVLVQLGLLRSFEKFASLGAKNRKQVKLRASGIIIICILQFGKS